MQILYKKAEFDNLKNNFQAQIDSYNQGIDSKIDSAIAAYLTGVKFVDDWKLPTTSKGLHRKVGAFLVFARNSMPYNRKNATKQALNSDTGGW